jgi:hypothetical protein
MHIYIGDVISLQEELTFEEKSKFIHETLAPELYKVRLGLVMQQYLVFCSVPVLLTERQIDRQIDRHTDRKTDR